MDDRAEPLALRAEKLADLTLALPSPVTDDVLHAIHALSADNRAIVLMADVPDYAYEDSATIMHCPVGTIRSRLHHGRQKLQKRLTSMPRLKDTCA